MGARLWRGLSLLFFMGGGCHWVPMRRGGRHGWCPTRHPIRTPRFLDGDSARCGPRSRRDAQSPNMSGSSSTFCVLRPMGRQGLLLRGLRCKLVLVNVVVGGSLLTTEAIVEEEGPGDRHWQGTLSVRARHGDMYPRHRGLERKLPPPPNPAWQ